MNKILSFVNEEFGEIRAMNIDGEPWFVGKDVAGKLGYRDMDQALRNHVDQEDKLTRQIDGSGQRRNMTLINESGLYALIIGSKLPEAKRFKRWVTSIVLPAIRRDGGYIQGEEEIKEKIQNPEISALEKELAEMKFIAESLQVAMNKIQGMKAQLEEQKPKVEFHDSVTIEGACTFEEFAKILSDEGYPIGTRRLFDLFRDQNWVYRKKQKHVPAQELLNQGFFKLEGSLFQKFGKPCYSYRLYITPAGQKFFKNAIANM